MAEYPTKELVFEGAYPATFIDIIGLGCGYRKELCPYESSGVPFISDWHHLNTTFLMEYLNDVFSEKNQSFFLDIGFAKILKY